MNDCHEKLQTQHYVTWKVPNFFRLSTRQDYFLDSPRFQFDGHTWCLRLYPGGWSEYNNEFSNVGEFMDICLVRLGTSDPDRDYYMCQIGLVTNDGKEEELVKDIVTDLTLGDQEVGICPTFLTRRLVEEERHIYVPCDTLTVYCRVLPEEVCRVATSSAATEHASTQAEIEEPSVKKLRSDYKKILTSEAESDLLVVVSGREFRAHKIILRARSPVFDAMFRHETQEKATCKIVIDDLNSDAFRDFLEYLYIGRVETLSDENVFGLYLAADKYDVQQLKSEALEHMRRTLSVESFCDVMALVLRHQEHDLMDRAVDFFKDNLSEIIVTVKWQAFMKENTTAANELFVKALVPTKAK